MSRPSMTAASLCRSDQTVLTAGHGKLTTLWQKQRLITAANHGRPKPWQQLVNAANNSFQQCSMLVLAGLWVAASSTSDREDSPVFH